MNVTSPLPFHCYLNKFSQKWELPNGYNISLTCTTNRRNYLVTEILEGSSTTQSTHLPHGVVGGDAVVTPSMEVEAHQIHAKVKFWSLER